MQFTKRQKQIIEVALKLIAEHGIQYMTIKHISEEIGISEPALYRHFDNKLEILKGIIEYFMSKMLPAFEKFSEPENPIKKIEIFISGHFKIFGANHNFARVFFSESNFQNNRELIDKMNDLMNYSRRNLERVVLEGQANDEIINKIDSVNIVRMIIGSMRFLVTQWSLSNMAFDLESEGNKLCKDILNLIRK